MQDLGITPSTIVFLGIILVLAALAIHRLVKRGACDCSDHCGGSCHSSKSGCNCGAVDDMVKNMEAAAKK